MKELKGKTAAITGGGSGLGRAMALAFAAEGMRIAIADVDQKGLDETGALLGDRLLLSQK
ncbi:MAG TPA: SDR family NAD(P)-dependent oxidoreductase, partial [Burkholderiales bacterium]